MTESSDCQLCLGQLATKGEFSHCPAWDTVTILSLYSVCSSCLFQDQVLEKLKSPTWVPSLTPLFPSSTEFNLSLSLAILTPKQLPNLFTSLCPHCHYPKTTSPWLSAFHLAPLQSIFPTITRVLKNSVPPCPFCPESGQWFGIAVALWIKSTLQLHWYPPYL